MPSTFLALQTGRSALDTSMMGVNIAGQNIANANTPGYAREVVDAETANSLQIFTDHTDYLGQGVNGKGTLRINDPFVDNQFRENNAQQSYWQTYSNEVNNVGQIFNEPSGTTLRNSIDQFFTAWDTLSKTPADGGARSGVYQAANSLVDAFHTTASTLQQNATRYQNELDTAYSDMTSVADSIAKLNAQIEHAQSEGVAPSDLLDQRDALVDKLSTFAAIKVTYSQVPHSPIVHMTIDLVGATPAGGGTPTNVNLLTDGTVNTAVSNGTAATIVPTLADQNGSLSALNDMITYTNGKLASVNQLADKIAQDVDGLQSTGYGFNGTSGATLFNTTSSQYVAANAASTIAVNTAITPSNLDPIAASDQATTSSGTNSTNGNNAQAIYGLLKSKDYDGTYAGIVTALGVDGQSANQQYQTFSALTTQAQQIRQSVSGVNINEEMTNMVQYQQAYSAASQYIKVFNDMLGTLIQSVS